MFPVYIRGSPAQATSDPKQHPLKKYAKGLVESIVNILFNNEDNKEKSTLSAALVVDRQTTLEWMMAFGQTLA